jgi:hypothetical protein
MALERRNYDPALMMGAIQSVSSADITDGDIVNADINASAAIAFTKLAALASTYILVGNGSNVPTAVAVSGDATLANTGALTIGAGAVTRAKMSAAGARKSVLQNSAEIATTGNTDAYVIVPEAGTLESIDFSAVSALTAHDSNYITFSITNLGQAGAGNTVMLAATDANTTKATGGTALVANAKRSLTVHGTPANLTVAAGDRLLIRAAATGTLAGAVTVPAYLLRFGGTT